MNEEEKDFFERCFGIVAGLEVENEAQAIAKEVVLDEVENLQQENHQLKDRINKAVEYIENNSLYDEEYDYNYEEEMYLSGIDDEVAKRDLLDLLKGDKE
jgi:hypothetical protein